MSINEYLPFGTAVNANVLPPSEYQTLPARDNGFVNGVADPKQCNTAWRQSSVMAATLGQFVADNSGKDALDDGDVAKLLTNLQDALKAHANSNLPAASTTVAGITKLSSATNSNDETMAATPKAVKAAFDMASKVSVDGLYPVGIVVWFAQNKDPNTLFPGTTWKYIGENRTIRLASANGSDVMTTGGSDSVALAVGNLPAHGHTFSANTSSFDYGTKTSSTFDHGTKTTDTQGDHNHIQGVRSGTTANMYGTVSVGKDYGFSGTSSADKVMAPYTNTTGAHAHNLYIGGHSHTMGIGAHLHSVSGTTDSTGSGSAMSVANAYVKLMGWYRSA